MIRLPPSELPPPRPAEGPAALELESASRNRVQPRSLPATRLALLGIIVVALALRLWGITAQLPWQFHPDEGHYVWKAVAMVEDGNLNPKYFRNPSLYTYLLFAEFKLLDLLALPLDRLGATWESLRPPSLYALLGRLTTALFGTATVYVVYRLGLELLGKAAGLLGAFLLATCFLHVRDSHFATNDVPATFFLTLSVLFSALLARAGQAGPAPRAGLRYALLAGLFGGLATSTKYNAGFFVAPLLVAWALAQGRRASRPRALAQLGAAGLVALAAYLAGTPFTVLAWPAFLADFRAQQRFAREGWEGQGPEPVGLLYLDALSQGLGWVVLGLAVVGFLLMARRRPAAALLAAYPLVYVAFMLGVKLFFVRFAVPVAPFLCLAGAYAIVKLAGVRRRGADVAATTIRDVIRSPGDPGLQRALARDEQLQRKQLLRAALGVALVLVAVAQPVRNDLLHGLITAQPDTRALAYAWLAANAPPAARIVADDYTVRDRRPRPDLPDRTRFDLDLVNALSERDLATYRQQGYDYAVASSFQSQRFPGRHATYAELDRQARLLATFAPTADGRELPFDMEDLYSPFHDLARYERPGPTVRIYALR